MHYFPSVAHAVLAEPHHLLVLLINKWRGQAAISLYIAMRNQPTATRRSNLASPLEQKGFVGSLARTGY